MRRGTGSAVHSGGVCLGFFAASDVQDVHTAALEVLQRYGVLVEASDALDLFNDAGCGVDRDSHIVKIPPDVASDAISTAPRCFRLCGRDRARDVLMEPGRSFLTVFSEPVMVNDLESGVNRESTKRDVAHIARLTDYLDEIEVNIVAVTARDVPAETSEQHGLEALLSNTTKPLCMSMYSGAGVRANVEMLAAVAGGHDMLRERPLMLSATCPVGPMVLPTGCTEVIVDCARAGVPCAVVSMDMAGASAPISLAGTLVVQHCEQLASLVLQQRAHRGAAFVYGTCTTAFDMRRATAPMGSPEAAMFQAGSVAIADHFGIPSWTLGFTSDSKVSDCQTGHEKTLTGLMALLAGAGIIEGPGVLEAGVTLDMAQLVADNEIVRMARQCARGIKVDDSTTAIEEIGQVGAGNEYLSRDSTYRHRDELSSTRIIDRQIREGWEAASCPEYHETARIEARRILEEHTVAPLPGDVAEQVKRIVDEADRAAVGVPSGR